ncbi:hypothetical protein [Primorskyibacter sp. S87]|uniref:hypothetical protein n=1 Tax=Primorskyibacter sp. S87 TaxID=3415126 RepID=UPI003C7CE054
MSRLLGGDQRLHEDMRAVFCEDLLIWQIRSLRVLLDDAARREPELIERGLLDAQFALVFDLIGQAMKRAGEQPDQEGSKGKGGRPVDAAGWELRTYALAAADALATALGGHGSKVEAQRIVISMMNAGGVSRSRKSYFEESRMNMPDTHPVDLKDLRLAAKHRLLEAHARGEPIEDYIRPAIHMRCRVFRLLERGGVVFSAAGRVMP